MKEIRAEINQATDEAEAMPDPVPTSIFRRSVCKNKRRGEEI